MTYKSTVHVSVSKSFIDFEIVEFRMGGYNMYLTVRRNGDMMEVGLETNTNVCKYHCEELRAKCTICLVSPVADYSKKYEECFGHAKGVEDDKFVSWDLAVNPENGCVTNDEFEFDVTFRVLKIKKGVAWSYLKDR